MTSEEAAFDYFRKEAKKIFAIHSPIIPTFGKLQINEKQFDDFKKDLSEKAMAVNVPNVAEQKKREEVESLSNDLDKFVRSFA